MKTFLSIAATMLLCFSSFAQAPDNSIDHTHKAKHEQTPFYFELQTNPPKDRKVCGNILEMKAGLWRAQVANGPSSQAFEIRMDAINWLKHYCPVQGDILIK